MWRGPSTLVMVSTLVASGSCGAGADGGRGPTSAGEVAAPVRADEAPRAGPIRRGRALSAGGDRFEVEVVEEPEARSRGLQGRARLGPDEGMLFVLPRGSPATFWMYRCLIPLDIVWLDPSGLVRHVEANVPPCPALPCPSYGPPAATPFVLEIAAGRAASAGIRAGAHVELLLEAPPSAR